MDISPQGPAQRLGWYCLLILSAIGSHTLASEQQTVGTSSLEGTASLEDLWQRARPLNTLCGITSAYVVLRELGMTRDYGSLLKTYPPGPYGNSMAQLTDCLVASGLKVTPAKVTATDLERSLRESKGQLAIVNTRGHWIVIRRTDAHLFFLLDYPEAYWLPVDALPRLWDGYAIIVSRQAPDGVISWSKIGIFAGILCIATVVVMHLSHFLKGRLCPAGP
jgi:Peptidase C39 family